MVGFAYVSLFSMLIGFVFWYRGLAQGGIAAVGQLQLLQPFFALGLAALLLEETASWAMLIATLCAVAVCRGGKTICRAAWPERQERSCRAACDAGVRTP